MHIRFSFHDTFLCQHTLDTITFWCWYEHIFFSHIQDARCPSKQCTVPTSRFFTVPWMPPDASLIKASRHFLLLVFDFDVAHFSSSFFFNIAVFSRHTCLWQAFEYRRIISRYLFSVVSIFPPPRQSPPTAPYRGRRWHIYATDVVNIIR